MKKIAFLILILFTVVQALPTMQSIWGNDLAIVLDITEEKKIAKEDTKANKEFISFYTTNMDLAVKIRTQIHLAECITASPSYEKITPPPDFC